MEEAEALLKFFDVVGAFRLRSWLRLSCGQRLRLQTRLGRWGLPKCSKAGGGRARKAAWRLKEAVKLGRRPSIEDYVKTLAARPASIAKSAVELLERNRRVLAGKTRGCGPPLCGWRRLRGWVF
jgi:hypothetical protein